MKNSNLISTVIYAQVLLIFISFKIPDTLSKKNMPVIDESSNNKVNVSTVVENIDQGILQGVTYNFNYPTLIDYKSEPHINFNLTIEEKIEEGKLKMGYGGVMNNSCHVVLNDSEITNQYVDYKLYQQNESFLSVLLLKGDYLSNNSYPKFSFYTMNYNFKTDTLLGFDDMFTSSSKDVFIKLMNTQLNKLGNCRSITEDVFENYKNNFVINNDYIKFYFDECVMCDDHHREYAIEIPLNEIKGKMIVSDLLK